MSDVDQALRDVVKSASIVYVGLFLELLIAFVAQVLAARYLSVSGFGGLTAGTALLNVGSIVAGLGLASGLTRYLPRVEGREKRMLATTAVGITFVISVALGLILTLNASFIASEVFGDPEVAVSLRIFGAAIPFSALLNVAIGGIRGQKRSLYRVYVKNIFHPLIRAALVAAAVFYGLNQAGIAGAYALPYVVSAVLALTLLHHSLPKAGVSFDTDLPKRMVDYSWPFTVTELSGFIYRSADIFLLLQFSGSFAVGVYGVAYASVSFMSMFSTAFNFLSSPVASELEHGGRIDDAMRVFGVTSRWLVITSVCMLVPLGVFSTEFIGIIYRSKYASGGIALAILAAGFAWKNVLGVNGPILQALGHSRLLSLNSVVAAATNIGLNLVLIPRFGIAGAAIATSLSYILRDGIAAIQVWYLLDSTPLTREVLGLVLIAVPFLGIFATSFAPHIPTTILWLVGTSALFSVIYTATVLLIFGISESEVMIIKSAEERYGLTLGPLDAVVKFLSNR